MQVTKGYVEKNIIKGINVQNPQDSLQGNIGYIHFVAPMLFQVTNSQQYSFLIEQNLYPTSWTIGF